MKPREPEKLTTADIASTPTRREDDARFRPPARPTESTTGPERMAHERMRTDEEMRTRAREEMGRPGEDRPARPVTGEERTSLFAADETTQLRSRWTAIQTEFVDEPRRSVEAADGLVASAIKRLAESFAEQRSRLEGEWSRGGDVSTEDLRLALQHYRSFFDRLLSV